MVGLEAEEEAVGQAGIAGEAEVGVGGHGAPTVDQLVDPAGGHGQRGPGRSGTGPRAP